MGLEIKGVSLGISISELLWYLWRHRQDLRELVKMINELLGKVSLKR